jgi:glycerol transport system ATP-binding protein
MVGDTSVKAVIEDEVPAQGEEVHLAFRKDQTRLYRDGWLSTEAGS